MSIFGDMLKFGFTSDGRDVTVEEGSLRLRGRSYKPGATTTVTVMLKDPGGHVLWARGTTVPTDGEAGYAKGCLFIDTDVGAGTTGLYVNVGSTTACDFDAVSDA